MALVLQEDPIVLGNLVGEVRKQGDFHRSQSSLLPGCIDPVGDITELWKSQPFTLQLTNRPPEEVSIGQCQEGAHLGSAVGLPGQVSELRIHGTRHHLGVDGTELLDAVAERNDLRGAHECAVTRKEKCDPLD